MWETETKSTKLTAFKFSASLHIWCKSRPKFTKLILFGAGLIPFKACEQTHTSNKNDRKRFFEKSFLLANIKLDVVYGMLFLTISNANNDFQAWDL